MQCFSSCLGSLHWPAFCAHGMTWSSCCVLNLQPRSWQKDQRTENTGFDKGWWAENMTQPRYCCVRIPSVRHRSKVLTEEVGLQQVHPAKVARHGRDSCWLAKLFVISLLPCLTPLKASLILVQVVSKLHVPTIRDYKVFSSLVVIFLPSPPTDTLDHTLQSPEKKRMSCMRA